MEILYIVKEALLNATSITALVMVMLLLVEFMNVFSSGKWMQKLQDRPILQVVVAGLMGLIPGCLGGFAVVSLFTHKMLSLPALITGMISNFGDEVFVLFAYSPAITLFIALILLIIGIVFGILLSLFYKKRTEIGHPLELHQDCNIQHDHCCDDNPPTASKILSVKNIKNISFPRAILLFGVIAYLFLLFSGTFSHQHAVIPDFSQYKQVNVNEPTCNMDEDCSEAHRHTICDHSQQTHGKEQDSRHEGHKHGIFSWENTLFATLALIVLVIVMFTSDHFLNEHLWEHVFKQHFLSVFLWTFGVLLGMHILFYFVDLNAFIATHQWTLLIVLLLALLIGAIPESGPHIIFIVMYFGNLIPFSILLANFIVQDGHSALPLIAESRRNFFLMKSVKTAIGLIVGLLGFFLKF